MLPTIIGIFTLILILICVLLVLVILMQRPSADAGMGASLGGGAAESAFGGETGNVLTSVCVKCIVVFFVLTFLLFMGNIYVSKTAENSAASSEVPSLSSVIDEVAEQAVAPAAAQKAAEGEAASKEAAAKTEPVQKQSVDNKDSKVKAAQPAPASK